MRRQDVQDAGGITNRIPARGALGAWPQLTGSYSGAGIPTNGTAGFATGCFWQNFLGSFGSTTSGLWWINTGTFLSSQWTNIDSLLPTTIPNAVVNLSGAGPYTMTAAANGNRTMLLNNTAGLTVNLPNATGSGYSYNFFVAATAATGNYVVQRGTTADVMSGVCITGKSTVTSDWLTASNSNTITLNGTTQGGILGDYIDLKDVATNQWQLKMVTSSSGTIATPFSNT